MYCGLLLMVNRVMHCMRAEIREMNEKGSIVNASSIAGIQGFPKNAAYTAAKVRKGTKGV